MCKRYKSIIISILICYSTIIFSQTNYDYPILSKANSIGFSGGAGLKYINSPNTFLTSLTLDSELIVIDSFGLSLTNYFFFNNKKEIFYGDNISLSINVRPMFIFQFIKNKYSKNYFIDYFYNSLSLNFGGIIQYTRFSKDKIEENKVIIGSKFGLSFAFLLSYNKLSDFYVKTSIDYSFLEDVKYNGYNYDMNGLHLQVSIGISFRFGNSVDWLFGQHENDKKVKIKFKD